MPRTNVVAECTVEADFRCQSVASMMDYDFQGESRREWDVDLPIDDLDWKIGLIHGPSGSGKTRLATQVFADASFVREDGWSSDKALISDLPADLPTREISQHLTSVGLSSVPSWFLPHAHLSTGERFRANILRALLEGGELIVCDEYTSVVDRTVARIASHAVQRMVRKGSKRFVAVSCHDDIVDWLRPDWRYEMGSAFFLTKTGSDQRSKSRLDDATAAYGPCLRRIII